jgi:hypothetical protein
MKKILFLTVLLVIAVTLTPVALILGLSSGEDIRTPAPAVSAPVPDELELDSQWMPALETLITLDEQQWTILKRISELDPAQCERLWWLLEQHVNLLGADYPTADGTITDYAIDGTITDYDIELLSFVVPDAPTLEGYYSPGCGIDVVCWIKEVLNKVVATYNYVTQNIPAVLEDIGDVVIDIGQRALKLVTDSGQFVIDTVEGAIPIIEDLRVRYNAFIASSSPSECDQLKDDLANFIEGPKGITAIVEKVVELVPWVLDVEETAGFDVDLSSDIVGEYVIGNIPCVLLFVVGLALDVIPGWQDLPETIYDFLPDPQGTDTVCDLLMQVPNLGDYTFIAKYAAEAATAGFEIIEGFCPEDLTLNIAGEGTTLPIAHPLKIIVGTITKTLNLVTVLTDALLTKVDNCGSDAFREEVTESLNALESGASDTYDYLFLSFTYIEAIMDYETAQRQLQLQVTELVEKTQYLISVTESGRPSEILPGGYRVEVSEKKPVSFVDVTAHTTVEEKRPGVYVMEIDLPKELRDYKFVMFEVWHLHEVLDGSDDPIVDPRTGQPVPPVLHSGFTLFDRTAVYMHN